MKTQRLQVGLTLIDMMIAVAIIAVLAGIVLTTLSRIDSKAKEQLCEGMLETLNTALRQFRDYGFEYRVPSTANSDEIEFYRSLKFPPDCNLFTEIQTQNEITKLLDLGMPAANISPDNRHDPNESGSAVMYFFLNQVPECRETLAGIDKSMLKSDHNNDEVYLTIWIDRNTRRSYPWLRVVDPWGTPLRYDYYDEKQVLVNKSANFGYAKQTIRSFPLVTSAGPDKKFDTTDDLTNRERTKGATYPP